jgi:hypothetical protein
MAVEPPSSEPGPDAFGILGPLEVVRSGRAVLALRCSKPTGW